MNTIKQPSENKLRLKCLKPGPRLAIRRLLRSFEPLEKPPKPSTFPGQTDHSEPT